MKRGKLSKLDKVLKILIVEDEPEVAGFVEQALREAGYAPQVAGTVAQARTALRQSKPDIVILDVMLPDGDGIAYLAELREQSAAPVLILTAHGSLADRVRGLDAGGDDYLVKPFRLEELLARIRALIRRRRGEEGVVEVRDVRIDLSARRVTQADRLVFLSTTEYSLLELLARNRGEPVSKAAILKHVWDDEGRDPNVVEVYVNYLRHKLERGGARRVVHTVRGRGYMLSEESPD